MLDWIHQLLKIGFITWGVILIVLSFATTIRSSLSQNHNTQAERIRRGFSIGAAIGLLAPAMAVIAYAFSADRMTIKTIFMMILASICFSPIGVIATVVTYYRLWGLPKLKDDLLFLSDKINKRT